MVKELAPFWAASCAVSGCVNEDEVTWGWPHSVEVQSLCSSLQGNGGISFYVRGGEQVTRTGVLLVCNKLRRPKTAFKRVDLPTLARPRISECISELPPSKREPLTGNDDLQA